MLTVCSIPSLAKECPPGYYGENCESKHILHPLFDDFIMSLDYTKIYLLFNIKLWRAVVEQTQLSMLEESITNDDFANTYTRKLLKNITF